MRKELKVLPVAFAVCAALVIGGCNEDKSAAKKEETPAATAPAEPAKTDLAAKVEAAKEAVKDAASAAADKVDAAAETAKEAAKDAADAAAVKVEAAKEAVKEAAADAKEAVDKAVEAAAPADPEPTPAPAAEAPAAEPAPAPAAEAPAAEPAPAPAEETKTAEAAPAPAADAPAPAAEAPAPAAAPAAPAASAAPASPENAEVQAKAKEDGIEFKDSRYRDKDGHPTPVVTKDYKVDWAVWQGFRRYHDACHVCHGPNALGSTFAPSLADSLKTMDYETFFGIVVGGRVADRGGTKYVMPAFGEDKNIMCYLDDIYTYIKARSINAEGKGGLPPGRPNGREDISPEAKQRAAECEG